MECLSAITGIRRLAYISSDAPRWHEASGHFGDSSRQKAEANTQMGELTRHCWHNGQIVERAATSVSVASFSFHTGTGIFDGLMAYWNRDHYYLLEGKAHFERLRSGAAYMGMHVHWTAPQLIQATHDVLKDEPPRTYYIRPIVYRGAPELWFSAAESCPVDVSIFGIPLPRGVRDSVDCELSPIQRVSSRAIPVKLKICGLYVNSYLTRRMANAHGVKDGIMIDRDGHIAEASASNVLFIDDNGIVTPTLNEDVFPGITRQIIFGICRKFAIPCIERNIFPADVGTMRAAFLCSTLSELKPISRIDSTSYPSANHPTFRAIAAEYEALTAERSAADG
jgi:branched-chain amino acid aminotransferase